jgi:hypothetical protein
LLWGVILSQCEGLSLLFVQKPDKNHDHALFIGAENVKERIFEPANASRFTVHHEDLVDIGNKLEALGDDFSEAEFKRFFAPEDDW